MAFRETSGAIRHGLFDDVAAHYAEPHRAYHTAQHIEECLMFVDMVGDECEDAARVELALWFHDAIYDPRAGDNEIRSADWAAKELEAAGASASVTTVLHSLILATAHSSVPATLDARITVDIDLAILGASPDRFEEYETQIRREYSWLPEGMFESERRKLLQRFLSRPSIYSTEFFREQLESSARQNLERSIRALAR